METERAKRLAGFVSWVGANIRGDEKGEAQVFLDRFFQAFGHAGLKEAGATLEERIKKGDGKEPRSRSHSAPDSRPGRTPHCSPEATGPRERGPEQFLAESSWTATNLRSMMTHRPGISCFPVRSIHTASPF